MKFYFWQELELDQRYGSVEALRKLAEVIEAHERKYACAVEIEHMHISISSEIEENCVPLHGNLIED